MNQANHINMYNTIIYTIQLIWISSCFFKVMVELKFVCYFFGCSLDLSFCVIVYSSQVIFFPYTLNTHTKYIKVKLWQLQILHIKVDTSSGHFKLFKNLYQPYLTLINQIWLECVICIIIYIILTFKINLYNIWIPCWYKTNDIIYQKYWTDKKPFANRKKPRQ